MMETFYENIWRILAVNYFRKSYIIDIWQSSGYTFE